MLTLKRIFQETKRIKESRILLWFHKSLQCLASWMTAGFSFAFEFNFYDITHQEASGKFY